MRTFSLPSARSNPDPSLSQRKRHDSTLHDGIRGSRGSISQLYHQWTYSVRYCTIFPKPLLTLPSGITTTNTSQS